MSALYRALKKPSGNPWNPPVRGYGNFPNIRYVQSPSQRRVHQRRVEALRRLRGF